MDWESDPPGHRLGPPWPQVTHRLIPHGPPWPHVSRRLVPHGPPWPQVSHRFPMDRVDEAFKAMLQRRVMGKALITMKDASKL